MFYLKVVLLTLISLSVSAQQKQVTFSKQQVQSWIIKADSYRLPFSSVEFTTSLILYKDDQKAQKSSYFVQLNNDGDSRVTMLDKRSKGQKVLLTENAMWLYIPRTRKAIRITPMQRLMGQASYGDVSSLSWQHEYQWDNGEVIEEKINNLSTLCFTLQATRKSATYRSIYSCLDKESLRPIKAKFYLASGKLMKQADFHYAIASPQLIEQTTFTQPNKNNQYTVMKSNGFKQKQHAASMFTRQGFIKK